MKLKERLSYFWNVTLGPDYTDQIDIENSNDPSIKELKDSLDRVKVIEQGLKTSTSNKTGKGKSSKIVETVVIDPKAIEAATKLASQKQKEQSVDKEQVR